MTMVQLPRFAALKSMYNNLYLRYLNDTSSEVYTYLQYSEEEVLSPYTKFEFEPAKSDPSLVHIRCCYNNRYWACLPTRHIYIVAGALEKDEDPTSWKCTMFRPVYDEVHQSFRFRHIHLGFNVVLWRVNTIFGRVLRAEWSAPDRDLCDLSIVINWDSLVSLPKFLGFKRDDVGLYLSARLIDGLPYLVFSSNSLDDSSIQMETYNTNDGRIGIKSNYLGRFWTRGTSNWILADATEFTTQNADTLFWATRLGPTIVALRNLGNGNFVKRFNLDSRVNYLNAATKEIDPFSDLRMTELVRSREIYDIVFHLSDARIRDEVVHVVASGTTTNTTKVPNTIDLNNVSYANITSSTWSSSISTKLDNVKTTLKSEVPRIVGGKENRIKICETTLISGGYKWGETTTTSKTSKITYQITVPPMSSVLIKVVATKGTCDVPFSYKQRDILMDGKIVEYSLEDGVYYGTNYYNLLTEHDTKPI